MKSLLLRISIILCPLFVSQYCSYAQNFHMVQDVNSATDGNPTNSYNNTTNNGILPYAVLNNVSYFGANDGIDHGTQLWRSDGTTAGTYLVKAVNGVRTNLNPDELITSGNYVFFTGTDDTYGRQLWRTDGTAAGTIMITHINLPNIFESLNFLTDVNGTLYFSVNNGNGDALYKSDGTITGTVLVKTIPSGNLNAHISNITNVQGKIFFFSGQYTDPYNGLWISDGTTAGTMQLIVSDNFSSNPPAAVNKNFFFNNNGAPWISDGTIAGTHLIKQINTLQYGSQPNGFTNLNGIAYFIATDTDHGSELWRSDGTEAGTYLVKDITPGTDSSTLTFFIPVDNIIYFLSLNNLGNTDLWKTDGTDAGTILVKNFGNDYLAPEQYLTNVNGTLYFQGYTAASGYEMWRSDGTTGGTVIVKDIYTGIYSASPQNFTAVNSQILFAATDGVTGNELWVTDGTAANTHLLKDINQTITSNGAEIFTNTPFNNKLYFRAYTPANGTELWVTNGTDAGTKRITDVQAGSLTGVNPYSVASKFDTSSTRLYFQAINLQYGNELWSTDGTTMDLVNDITPGRAGTTFPESYFPGSKKEFCNVDSTVFFVSGSQENELWKTTGKGAVSIMQSSEISGLTPNNNDVYFTDNTGTLWMINKSANMPVKINGAALVPSNFSIPQIVSYKTKIFFQSSDKTMWVTDGTDAGTAEFKNINTQFDDPTNFVNTTHVILNDILYFLANDGTTGLELWKTDGTANGTVLVKDINAGITSAFSDAYHSGYFIKLNNVFYFLANDGVHGNELWKTDGTTAGTVIVKDITPGSASTQISSLTQVGDKLAFLIYDSTTQNEIIWQSDGTSAGTDAVNDANLNNVTITDYFNNALVAENNQLYFIGYTYKYGNELWTGILSSVLAADLLTFTGNLVNNTDAHLNWKTVNEQNFSHFIVQRSIDGTHFSNIANISSKYNSTPGTNYVYTDKNIAGLGVPTVYYRLALVDKDGKTSLSKVILLQLAGYNINVSLQPNPVTSAFKLLVTNVQSPQDVEVLVVNARGSIMLSGKRTLSSGSDILNYDASAWAAGVYIVKLTIAGKQVKEIKLVKQ